MKSLWLTDLKWLGPGFALCLSLTACHKTPPPFSQAAKNALLDWNLKTTVDAYHQNGDTNSQWDLSAERALSEFASIRAGLPDTNESPDAVISANATAAVQAGCTDPMVNYLYIRYGMDQSSSKATFTTALAKMAKDMNASAYPPVRKFYASFRTTQQYAWANNYPTNWPPDMDDLKQSAEDNLFAMLSDKTTPAKEIYDACYEFLNMWGGAPSVEQTYYNRMEPTLFANWPNSPYPLMLKGNFYIDYAWYARGNGYADSVTAEGGRLFEDRLAVAKQSFEDAWKLNPQDPHIAEQMIRVELGLGDGRDNMELWFNRAMNLNPADYDACQSKLYYLTPKWYGSDADQLAFGRECVTNTDWTGRVPLTLVDAHRQIYDRLDPSEQAGYWKRPGVWPDIQSAFDRFFTLNPDAVSWHHNYAWYAYYSGQWDEFLHQITLFGDTTNYNYFGGKDAFDYMVETARNAAGK